ncbi:MAG: inositol monophosphatase family protein [Candidatus Omnitrophota bacterium]
MNEFLETCLRAAVKAGDFARRRKGRIREISYKGAINLVTDVDKDCEEIIVSAIRKKFPSHGILSEENYSEVKPAEFRWIVDPIDGTTNFSRGVPIYSVSVALEHSGRIVAGVIYDPERKELFSAAEGGGSFMNRKRIRVSATGRLKRAFLVTGFAYNARRTSAGNMGYFGTFLKRALAVRRLGSAALDMAYVACGRFDGFWEMDLHPWDSAAGALIVEEAGGKVTAYDGTCYSPFNDTLLSTNSRIHGQMMKILSG